MEVSGPQVSTYRGQTSPSAGTGLQAGRGRPDAPKRLSVSESVGVPGLRARQIVGIRVIVLQRRGQALETSGFVASHLVFVDIRGHGTVSIKLTRGLTMQGLLMALRTGGTRGWVVIHIRRLVTHGDGWHEEISGGREEAPEECEQAGFHHNKVPQRN